MSDAASSFPSAPNAAEASAGAEPIFRPKPQPGIMDISLYQGGESSLNDDRPVLKLSSNENPRGPSPKARAAFVEAAAALHRYPSTDHAALRRAIGAVYGLDPERIICGAGSDEVLQFVASSFAGVGDEVIVTRHGFAMYPILARMVGATPIEVPETERRVDVEAILAALSPRTKLVFLANPGNPTGTMLSTETLAWLAAKLPSDVVLVIDAAYAEYVPGYDGGAALVSRHSNVVMTRTFSKIYGLGGLRIGWGYGQRQMIEVLNRVRQPFNLSIAQLAAAEAAVLDQAWVAACRNEVLEARQFLTDGLRALGLAVDESHANFVLARFRDADAARAADAALRADRILVRRVANYHLPEALRITIGTRADCGRVLSVLAQHVRGAP